MATTIKESLNSQGKPLFQCFPQVFLKSVATGETRAQEIEPASDHRAQEIVIWKPIRGRIPGVGTPTCS